jgi:diguanylate cyclase (GGDEF)-like protein
MTSLGVSTFVLMDVINRADGQIAKCSMEVGFSFNQTIFDTVIQAVNSVRTAIDEGLVIFYAAEIRQGTYRRIKRQEQPSKRRSQAEIHKFLAGKAYVLGFFAVDEPSEVWAADPWDAQYLGVSRKELLLGMRVLRAKKLLDLGSSSEYARPTDKLLAEQSSEKQSEEMFFPSQHNPTRLSLPNKEVLLADMQTILERHSVSSLLVIDLDNFKSVNDTSGHSEGDACLDRVISTIGTVVGRKGKIYRWGGDEFAVCLPDFSTEEAQVTAERIRHTVEQAKPGGEITVTTSIGVCASDRIDSKSAAELLNFADKAMYESKRLGKNRSTVWPFLPMTAQEQVETEASGS